MTGKNQMGSHDISHELSFHEVKDVIRKSCEQRQAVQIAANLAAHIGRTRLAAPRRESDYPLIRSHPADRTSGHVVNAFEDLKEVHWELASWNQKDIFQNVGPIKRLQSYQVMTRGSNANKGWGEVDLLAVGHDDMPVVIELKANKHESLLRAICESVAYAISLQENWDRFGSQWRRDAEVRVGCDHPTSMDIVIAAPKAWWIGVRPFDEAQMKLVQSLKHYGFLIHYLSLNHSGLECGLPKLAKPEIVPQV
jgi:Holliday junction resolvase-like predicted endonuclease